MDWTLPSRCFYLVFVYWKNVIWTRLWWNSRIEITIVDVKMSFRNVLRKNYFNENKFLFLYDSDCQGVVPPADIYLFKVNNENTRTMCGIFSKLTINTTEQRQWLRFGFLWITLNRFLTLFWFFYCWLWTSICQLGLD